MTEIKDSVPPGLGVEIADVIATFLNKTGVVLSKGDVVQVAMEAGATYTSDNPHAADSASNANTSPFCVVETPTSIATGGLAGSATVATPSYMWGGIVQSTIAINGYGPVMLRGRTQAASAGVAITRGVPLYPTVNRQLTATNALGSRVFAVACANAAATAGILVDVYVEGINTFGAGTAFAS